VSIGVPPWLLFGRGSAALGIKDDLTEEAINLTCVDLNWNGGIDLLDLYLLQLYLAGRIDSLACGNAASREKPE